MLGKTSQDAAASCSSLLCRRYPFGKMEFLGLKRAPLLQEGDGGRLLKCDILQETTAFPLFSASAINRNRHRVCLLLKDRSQLISRLGMSLDFILPVLNKDDVWGIGNFSRSHARVLRTDTTERLTPLAFIFCVLRLVSSCTHYFCPTASFVVLPIACKTASRSRATSLVTLCCNIHEASLLEG